MTGNDLQHDENGPVVTPVVETDCSPAVCQNGSDATRKEEHSQGSTHAGRAPGGQPANTSALRHGLRAARMPRDARYVEHAAQKLRQSLEAAVMTRHGAVSVYHAALVSSAVRHESRAMLLQRWLRLATEPERRTAATTTKSEGRTGTVSIAKESGLGIMDRAQLLAQISAATDSRDRCLERLGLDVGSALMPWQIHATAQDAPQRDASGPDVQSAKHETGGV
jgi:hypothetical protein